MRSGIYDSAWREKLPPICPGCGYNLTGIESTRCPECGRAVLWSELRTNARTLYHALRQVEDVNDVIDVGMYLGSAALIMILGCYAVNWGVGLSRVVGCLLAIATLGSGLQVLRVRRFPEWAAEQLPQQPNYTKAACLVCFALVAIALAIFLPSR
ncbi:MAG TPA: hypothetical protein P5572_13050 [Phycisphaerae bacterium]|nr:hypothetical protein [Phycisphaerales bacterium]HRX85939.1 hypothetical protein [Phycisphaerae bacterium]